jgi:hypothetical protein
MSRSSHVVAAVRAALLDNARRAARPALRLEALGDRVLPSGMFPTSIGLRSDGIGSPGRGSSLRRQLTSRAPPRDSSTERRSPGQTTFPLL